MGSRPRNRSRSRTHRARRQGATCPHRPAIASAPSPVPGSTRRWRSVSTRRGSRSSWKEQSKLASVFPGGSPESRSEGRRRPSAESSSSRNRCSASSSLITVEIRSRRDAGACRRWRASGRSLPGNAATANTLSFALAESPQVVPHCARRDPEPAPWAVLSFLRHENRHGAFRSSTTRTGRTVQLPRPSAWRVGRCQ
jgi:hypothetical protein